MALEACNFEKCLIFQGKSNVDESIIVYSLSKVPPSVTIIVPTGRSRILLSRFPEKLNNSFSSTSTIESIIRDVDTAKVCIIDSLDLFILSFGIDAVCKFIHKLKETRLVISSCNETTVSESEWFRLQSVADSFFTLSCSKSEQDVVAEGISFKMNGKTISVKEFVNVSKNLKMKSTKYEEKLPQISHEPETIPSSSFNIGVQMKETEKIAKEELILPYITSSSIEGLGNLRAADKKVRVGGQIIYTPDEADDLDDSDPDDDLNL